MPKAPITEEIIKVVEAEREKMRAIWELGPEGSLRDMPSTKVMKAYENILKCRELINPEFSMDELELARKIVDGA